MDTAPTSLLRVPSVKPACVQPGGGPLMEAEQLWARLRRAYLRKFFPTYVRQMQARRQGTCPECPHDVVDSRDLKYVRNACGYRFRSDDDPFRGRDRLGFARHGLAELGLATLLFVLGGGACLLLAVYVHAAFWLLFVAVLLVWLEVVWFFRDPERAIPTESGVCVSPADGLVTNVEEVEEPELGAVLRISIFLSIFDVHVNRSPCTAEVAEVRYYPGAFLDARNPESAVRNEQLWVDLVEAATGWPIRVKQISGAIARRIVCWLRPGVCVGRGERFGMIKFGSRTDLLLPRAAVERVHVHVGMHVRGGSSVLLSLKSGHRDGASP